MVYFEIHKEFYCLCKKYKFVQLTLFAIKYYAINLLYLFPIGNMFKTATTSDFGISKERGIIRL